MVENGQINLESANKCVDEKIDDKDWKKLYKDNLKACKSETEANSEEIATKWTSAPFNVAKEQCDFRISSWFICINLNIYLVKYLFLFFLEIILKPENF